MEAPNDIVSFNSSFNTLNQTSSSRLVQKHTSFEYEVLRSKGVQADTSQDNQSCESPKCPKVRRKKKKKRQKDCSEKPCQAICLEEDVCKKHSFCLVDGLKKHGCKPLYPKGLPWASGKLLYYPGQRPKYLGIIRETPEEISKIQKAKRRKDKKAQQKKEKALASLREKDDEKLCDVVSTSQEMMILMRALALVTQERNRNKNKHPALIQYEKVVDEEEEGEEEEANKGNVDKKLLEEMMNELNKMEEMAPEEGGGEENEGMEAN